MHYLLGLAALVLGALIATRRTRPTWFVVLTCVLVAIGALLAILSYTRVTDPMGLLANSILGWVFVGLSIITMLSAVFVLERRGEHGEELPPLIGDNPFDGDIDDSDDPVRGRGSAAAEAAVLGGAASAGAAGSVAAGSAGYAGVGAAGAEAYAADFADQPVRDGAAPTDADYDAWEAAGEPERSADRPGPSDAAENGTTVIGADPDLATPPAETDVNAAPEGTDGAETDDHLGTPRP
ncbi:hypothetical protein SAMN04487783_0385 [Agrococcus baldri]|uniref:Uncharacterized protein n=1 Tax=Agrococcus baldri TaxID=153730 RepID=A0AA94HKG0_9MICO|nr:hypothetical protein [Agrococcus baldri]SFR99770.1 hypothetical protein SAMN04487783_0385 [Agrococcus baldri]